MSHGFDRACPSGNVMVELSGEEAHDYGFECKCGAEYDDSHKCRYCLEDITAADCEDNKGMCIECKQFEKEGETDVDITVESEEVHSGVCDVAQVAELHKSVEGVY